jgi:hypothetical protein
MEPTAESRISGKYLRPHRPRSRRPSSVTATILSILPERLVLMRHALQNALIASFMSHGATCDLSCVNGGSTFGCQGYRGRGTPCVAIRFVQTMPSWQTFATRPVAGCNSPSLARRPCFSRSGLFRYTIWHFDNPAHHKVFWADSAECSRLPAFAHEAVGTNQLEHSFTHVVVMFELRSVSCGTALSAPQMKSNIAPPRRDDVGETAGRPEKISGLADV